MLVLLLRNWGVDELTSLDVLAIELVLRNVSSVVSLTNVGVWTSATIVCNILCRWLGANNELLLAHTVRATYNLGLNLTTLRRPVFLGLRSRKLIDAIIHSLHLSRIKLIHLYRIFKMSHFLIFMIILVHNRTIHPIVPTLLTDFLEDASMRSCPQIWILNLVGNHMTLVLLMNWLWHVRYPCNRSCRWLLSNASVVATDLVHCIVLAHLSWGVLGCVGWCG